MTVSRSDSTISITNLYEIRVKSADSILFAKDYYRFSETDTLKLDSLSDGNYEIEYSDILGNRKIQKFNLNGGEKQVLDIVFDSIDIRNFIKEVPINTIKNWESYKVERKGGCIATMYGYYTVSKTNGSFYFDTPYRKARLLTRSQIKAVKKFEAELLAINGADVCISTGRMHYKIICNGKVTEITDNTCNWHGWEILMSQIPIDKKTE
jgi:hypothetical protein